MIAGAPEIPDQLAKAGLALRAVSREDDDVLFDLFATHKAPEFAMAGLDTAALGAILTQQWRAREHSLRVAMPGALRWMVIWKDMPIGQLAVHVGAEALHVIDILLHPRWRGGGIGGALISGCQAMGAERGLPVTLRVARDNPAIRLYTRMGFKPIEERVIDTVMMWRPKALAAAD